MDMLSPVIRRDLIEFALDLLSSQGELGAWHGDDVGLQSVVMTSQCALFVAGFKGVSFSVALDDAARWLTRPSVTANEYSYWRLLPLIEIGAERASIQSARTQTLNKIEAGVLHHENSPIHPFYVDCALRLNVLDSTAKKLLDQWAKQLEEPSTDWTAERLAYILEVLARSDMEVTPAKWDVAFSTLESTSVLEGNRRYWPTLVKTAYVAMNLVAVASAHDRREYRERARSLVQESLQYLCERWESGAFDSEPLAGGDFDDTQYVKVVVARALAEAGDLAMPRWREEEWVAHIGIKSAVHKKQLAHERTKSRLRLVVCIGLGLIVLGEVVAAIVTYLDIGNLWTWIGRIADLGGVLTIVGGIFGWYRGRRRQPNPGN